MAKFKVLNRFVRTIRKKNPENRESRLRGWNAIFRTRKKSESTPPNNGSTSNSPRRRIGLLRALSSFFKKPTRSDNRPDLHVENELHESYTGSIDHDILAEPSVDHPQDIVADNAILRQVQVFNDASLSSTELVGSVTDQTMKENNSICQYCQGRSKEVSIHPEDWETSTEWLVFDIPEELDCEIELKSKKVTWKDDVTVDHVDDDVDHADDDVDHVDDDVDHVDDDIDHVDDDDDNVDDVDDDGDNDDGDNDDDEIEKLSTELNEVTSDSTKQQDAVTTLLTWQWITAVSIVFLILLLL